MKTSFIKIISFLIKLYLMTLISQSAFAKKKTILVIESYHEKFSWAIQYRKGIEENLAKKYDIKYFRMNTKHLPKKDHPYQAEKAWDKYKELNPILVMLCDDNALKYMAPNLEKSSTPAVYLGVNANPRDYIKIGKNFSGVLERALLQRSVLLMRKLLNEKLNKVLILFDKSVSSLAIYKESFRENNSIDISGTTAEIKLLDTITQWEKEVKKARKSKYKAIFIGTHHTVKDVKGEVIESGKMAKMVTAMTDLPIFSFWAHTVGKNSAIGGVVVDGYEQGDLAGKIAKRILAGESPQSIFPVRATRGRFLFSKSKIDQFKIKIPKDLSSEIEYLP